MLETWILSTVCLGVIAFSVIIWLRLKELRKSTEELRACHVESLCVQEDEHKAYLKRLHREFEHTQWNEQLSLATSLLPCLDILSESIDWGKAHVDPEEHLLVALQGAQKEMLHAFSQHGIQRIDADIRSDFDPNVHQAMGMVDTHEVPEGQIAQTLRDGWQHTSKVLRPTWVLLARSLSESERVDETDTSQESVHEQLVEEHIDCMDEVSNEQSIEPCLQNDMNVEVKLSGE